MNAHAKHRDGRRRLPRRSPGRAASSARCYQAAVPRPSSRLRRRYELRHAVLCKRWCRRIRLRQPEELHLHLWVKSDALEAHRSEFIGASVGKGCIRYTKPEKVDLGAVGRLLKAIAASKGRVC